MEPNYINQITLDCLMNKDQKSKLIYYSDQTNKKTMNKREKKFYRRRILHLTKDMLLNNYSEDVLSDVKDAFEYYVKTCVGYFKIKDETDYLQEDYINETLLDDTIQSMLDNDDIVSPEEANKLMMRSIRVNNLPLDKFVKVKQLKPSTPPILPTQKDINLSDPCLKNKGIRKKKNIHNNYDELSTKKDETQTTETSNKK